MATQLKRPTGDATTQWGLFGDTPRYNCVDEVTADGDSTYIDTATNAKKQRFTFPAFDITSSSINKVTVHWNGKQVNPATGGVRPALRVNGTDYLGNTYALTDSYADYDTVSDDWLTNPNTGLAWLETDVEGTGSNPLQQIQLESRNLTSTEGIRVTQTYIQVDYEVPTGGIKASPLTLMGVGI